MIAAKFNPGSWYCRECKNEDTWPEERRWTVESNRGFQLDITCYILTDGSETIIDFGEFPYTEGFTKEEAEKIVKLLNKRG